MQICVRPNPANHVRAENNDNEKVANHIDVKVDVKDQNTFFCSKLILKLDAKHLDNNQLWHQDADVVRAQR